MVTIEDGKDEYVAIKFSKLVLPEVELESKEFDGCTFEDCDFSKATFTRCKFIDCEFVSCNLSNARVEYSTFRDTEFYQCKAIGIDWTRVSWPMLSLTSPLAFRKCLLNDSSFFGLELTELIFEDCKAHDVDFREADLSDANFSYTDFGGALFGKTKLANANFEEATDYDIDLFDNNLKGAKFSRFEAVRLLEGLGVVLVD